MKTVVTIAIWLALSLGFAYGQRGPAVTNDHVAALIAEVQRALASNLDSNLPRVSLEEWMLGQIGSDASIAWAVRTGVGGDLPYVEADISVGGRPGIVIMIACGKPGKATKAQPIFKSLELLREGEFAGWPHLHDLPIAMKKVRREG